MKRPYLKQGDIALTTNPMALGRAINAVQRYRSKDNKSQYSHALLITGPRSTYEALWTVKHQDFFNAYNGDRVLIARHDEMNLIRFVRGYKKVISRSGQIYPVHRFLFFLIHPPFLKYIPGPLTCGELVTEFLSASGVTDLYPRGITPDDLHDMVRKTKGWNITWEGVLNA